MMMTADCHVTEVRIRQSTKLIFTVFLLATAIAWAQAPSPYSDMQDPDLLVRLSYQRSALHPDGRQRICIFVSQDGDYRIIWWGDALGVPTPVRLKGKMDDDQLLRLKKMLTRFALRSLPRNNPGMIRDHSENFMAEITRIEHPPAFRLQSTPTERPRSIPPSPRRLQWLNADDQTPFPAPIAKLVDWMKNFKPKSAKQFDYSEFPDVCPSVGLSLVQPSIAANEHP
jgi:hypothetical protein